MREIDIQQLMNQLGISLYEWQRWLSIQNQSDKVERVYTVDGKTEVTITPVPIVDKLSS